MTRWLRIRNIFALATVGTLLALAQPAQAQQSHSDATEVYLSFQYRGVVGKYVTTYYKDQQFYLPVNELFNILKINHETDQGSLVISGNYLGKKDFEFDFDHQTARADNTQITLRASDFLIKEIDYFVKPEVFKKLFGLNFKTNFNNLTLDLETKDKMPVVAQYEREQKRQQLNRDKTLFDNSYYPLQYKRTHSALDGVFLDYNLSAVLSQNSQLLTFNNALGMELLGGDLQGSMFGAFSAQQNTFTTNNLRWRYVTRNSDWFSSAEVGQTNSEGIANRPITGVKVSNKPVESRRLFDRYPIEGSAPAQSEVELYLNNQLVDYQQADQSGNYRFLVPLTYGSTDYEVRIYTPEGRSIQQRSHLQIPFDYLPPKEIDYSISGGQLQNPILGSNTRGYIAEASVATGITNWLTAKVSSEYLTNYHENLPSFTGTLNARLFQKYLVSANINSEKFYRLTSSVVYSSGASWSLSYDYNPGNNRIYSVGGSKHQARINLFTPFQLGKVPLNIRWSSTYQQDGGSALLRYRADLSTRLGRLNVRLGYQDQQAGHPTFETTNASRLTNSYTYSVGRFRDIPGLLRGMFLRGQLTYLPGLHHFEEVEFQLSRDLLQTGRLQLGYGHNFLGNFNSVNLNVTINFNKIRSNTTMRTTGSSFSATQNIRGSIGYDSYGDQLLLNNRQQVGQSGAAVRLFVDNNNDGTYQDSTDDIISDPAVRLNRAGGRTKVKNGINYITQLQPYYRYDIEVNKGALSNPMLVPEMENFSIVTDPNQYKTIEIPFYQSGVISGKVQQKKDSTFKSLSGVRLFLKSDYDNSSQRENFSKEMRTFSDGSFYTYEIPPGKYDLYIDPNQLDFLKSVSQPDTMHIEVEPLAQGDFIEGLNFTVRSKATDTSSLEGAKKITSKTSSKNSVTDSTASRHKERDLYYKIQMASFNRQAQAEELAAQATKQLGGSFSVVKNTRNGLFAVRSVPVFSQKQAIETIISYHNGSYKSAALVVLRNKEKKSAFPQGKFIQIGAFSTKKHAQHFASSSSNKISRPTAVTLDPNTNLYIVYVNKTDPQKSLRQELTAIRDSFSFSDAFINERKQIQIAAFRNKQSAFGFRKTAQDYLNRDIGIFYDADENYYNIYIKGPYTASERREILQQIRNIPSPFKNAFVSTLGRNPDQTTEKAMDFSYQVQVEGVTAQTEQAFLSAISNPDSRISHPNKKTIVFNNVNSWKQAQELQRKLSQVSTIGYPIVVLIEQN